MWISYTQSKPLNISAESRNACSLFKLFQYKCKQPGKTPCCDFITAPNSSALLSEPRLHQWLCHTQMTACDKWSCQKSVSRANLDVTQEPSKWFKAWKKKKSASVLSICSEHNVNKYQVNKGWKSIKKDLGSLELAKLCCYKVCPRGWGGKGVDYSFLYRSESCHYRGWRQTEQQKKCSL